MEGWWLQINTASRQANGIRLLGQTIHCQDRMMILWLCYPWWFDSRHEDVSSRLERIRWHRGCWNPSCKLRHKGTGNFQNSKVEVLWWRGEFGSLIECLTAIQEFFRTRTNTTRPGSYSVRLPLSLSPWTTRQAILAPILSPLPLLLLHFLIAKLNASFLHFSFSPKVGYNISAAATCVAFSRGNNLRVSILSFSYYADSCHCLVLCLYREYGHKQVHTCVPRSANTVY